MRMKFKQYIIECQNYDSLMKNLEVTLELEKKIHDYPTMVTIIDFIKNINIAKGKKLKDITTEFDKYCKLALGWKIRGMDTDIVEKAYDFAIEKRKTVFPKYNLKATKIAIKFFQEEYDKAKKRGWHVDILRQVIENLSNVKELLKEPWRVGLEEETQYPTLKREITSELNYAKKYCKKRYEGFILDKLLEFEKDIKILKK